MNRVIVIGVGSPFGADNLGWRVVERLEQNHQHDFGLNVELVACDRPGTMLLDYFNNQYKAIIVDAIAGGCYGRIVRVDRKSLLTNEGMLSTHSAGVAETLVLGEKLNLLPGEIILLGVETGMGAQSRSFSTTVIQQLAEIVVCEVNVSEVDVSEAN